MKRSHLSDAAQSSSGREYTLPAKEEERFKGLMEVLTVLFNEQEHAKYEDFLELVNDVADSAQLGLITETS